jgi:hypothetical protein
MSGTVEVLLGVLKGRWEDSIGEATISLLSPAELRLRLPHQCWSRYYFRQLRNVALAGSVKLKHQPLPEKRHPAALGFWRSGV